MMLRSLIIWICIRTFVSAVAGSVVLEWQAALALALLAGGLAHADTVRCHEPVFLGNCGIAGTSLLLLTLGTPLLLEVALYAGYAAWITS